MEARKYLINMIKNWEIMCDYGRRDSLVQS